jgi:hypothetical protein
MLSAPEVEVSVGHPTEGTNGKGAGNSAFSAAQEMLGDDV